MCGAQIPAWPFIAASFATGIFALLPYFAIWDAPKKPLQLPPKKAELVRRSSPQPASCKDHCSCPRDHG
jgi:hypothetical protein